jgi:hypothetical protein
VLEAPAGLSVPGVNNLRDVSRFAPSVVPGRLLRSGRWSLATEAGRARLRDHLQGGTLIDLRSEAERAGEPGLDALWPGWWRDDARLPPSNRGGCWLPMPLLGRRVIARGLWAAGGPRDRARLVGHRLRGEAQVRAAVEAQLAAGGLRPLYLWTLLGAERRFGRALRRLGASGGATLICCAAGKDRTGLLVAVALLCAGVPRDEVLADYAASAAARAQLGADPVVTAGLVAAGLDPGPFLDADPALLDDVLQAAFAKRGGFAAWRARAGIDAAEALRLSRLLRG